MKVYKIVAYSSLAICLLTALVIGSVPFRFPHSTIAWNLIFIFGIPLIALTALLFIKPALSLRSYRSTLMTLAALSIIAALVGWMPWLITGLMLVALGALYLPQKAQL